MSKPASKRVISGRPLKLVAGGVSLVVLAILAVLAVGLFADRPAPYSPPCQSTARGFCCPVRRSRILWQYSPALRHSKG